jgi:hypothetical protein
MVRSEVLATKTWAMVVDYEGVVEDYEDVVVGYDYEGVIEITEMWY